MALPMLPPSPPSRCERRNNFEVIAITEAVTSSTPSSPQSPHSTESAEAASTTKISTNLTNFFEHYPLQHFYDHHHHMDYSPCAYEQLASYNNAHIHTNIHSTSTSQAQAELNSAQILGNSANINRNCTTIDYPQPIIGSTCDQIIGYIDSPPNSKESWTDEQQPDNESIGGAHILEIKSHCPRNGIRKRRMDWDALDCAGPTTHQAGDNRNNNNSKTPILKELRQRRDKGTNGRPSWTDDIGFDLGSDFNSNPYMNNESFLSTYMLKQEPPSEQLKIQKCSISPHPPESVIKLDRSSTIARNSQLESAKAVDSNDSELCKVLCEVSGATASNTTISNNAPHQLQGCNEQVNGNANDNDNENENDHGNGSGSGRKAGESAGDSFDLDKCKERCEAFIQQLCDSATGTLDSTIADDHKFQYILAAATSIATKNNEETLTYLNQGQSYEIKLKKIGDLSFYRDKILKSIIKICFHERRLQFMEREQMQQWQASRPGERIIEVDVPLSYGLCHVSQPLNPGSLNTVEILWDPFKEVGVYIKVNCISTEFTPKKHGGEKGVPFRLQIETYIDNSTPTSTNTAATAGASTAATSPCPTPIATTGSVDNHITNSHSNSCSNNSSMSISMNSLGSSCNTVLPQSPVHAAACQIKVFKLKGADRKHKQDREKILRRPQSEQEKFQPSYECTIMNDIPLDMLSVALVPPATAPVTSIATATATATPTAAVSFSPEYRGWPHSPSHLSKYDTAIPQYAIGSPAANGNAMPPASAHSPTLKLMDHTAMLSPAQSANEGDDYIANITPESSPAVVMQWLSFHRLGAYLSTFAHFSGADIMRMSKEDLIQICGLADGIRMFNILRAKSISPRLTLYVSLDGCNYHALYLIQANTKELMHKLFNLPGFYALMSNSADSMMDNTNDGMQLSNWNGAGMQTKYSSSGTNIFDDASKASSIYVSGPSGVHVTITDDVLSNELKDGSLYALEVQNGKVLLKLITKNDA